MQMTHRYIMSTMSPRKLKKTINNDLARVDIWYEENGLRRNPAKYQAIVMGKAQNKPQFCCENTEISITNDFEVLGVTIDDKLKFEKHVAPKYAEKSLSKLRY